ncbi:MAG TPA: hypothetical protein PK014_14125 [Thermoanaerobaculia bacterium]|nr:hypothetical protein [Thermoanaerobaculia bacterium]HUM31201.1 hypothetical protein [Thermoanaerobaculia bacterium]HXK69563.1 hypothetical protein [Thermoanaerobaculia bacterium]
MFVQLLIIIFVIAAVTSTIAALLFSRPVNKILGRLVSEQLAPIWRRYILFAIYVVGISGGVRVWDLERYINPDKEGNVLTLNSDRWVIEVYKTIMGSLQAVAWMLLIFFLFALVAYVVVRGFELKHSGGEKEKENKG